MQTTEVTRDYEYGPPEKRGYVLGLQPIQIGALAVVAFGVSALMLMDRVPLAVLSLTFGLLANFFPVSPLPPFLFTWQDRHLMLVLQDGRPPILWLPLMWSWGRRRLSNQHRWASARHLDQNVVLAKWGTPAEVGLAPNVSRKVRRATRRLQPESIQGLQILSVTGFGQGMDVGIIHDLRERTYTAFTGLLGRDYALLADAEKGRLNDLWGGCFEPYGDPTSPVARVQVIERTVAEDGETLSRAYRERKVHQPGLEKADNSYAELVDQAAPLAQRHECFVGLKIDLRRQVALNAAKRRGNGNAHLGAQLLVFDELTMLAGNLAGAELTVLGAVPPRLLAEVIRFGYDPEQRGPAADRDREAAGAEEGMDPVDAWPSYSEERLGWYRSDSGFHITGHIREWPKRPVSAGFLRPLLLETTYTRTVSLTYEVRPGVVAAKEFRTSATTDSLNKRIRDRWGFRDTPQREAERENVLRAEREAAEGHAVIAWSAYVTVTGDTVEHAEDAWAEAVRRASGSNLVLQRLYGLQEAAFTYSLPLARGLA